LHTIIVQLTHLIHKELTKRVVISKLPVI